MFFDRNKVKCENCGSKVEGKFSFCPYCGSNFLSSPQEKKDFGFLGRNDLSEQEETIQPQFGIMDKIFSSMVNSMMKNLDKQFRSQLRNDMDFEKTEIRGFPNGIKIKISGPFGFEQPVRQKKKSARQEVDEGQIRKMNSLPRVKAKANVKRFGNRIVYELATPGVSSPQDVFVSKLESGYEIKAIGDKKVYVNSLAVNLPLRKYSILKNKLLIEFFDGAQGNWIF